MANVVITGAGRGIALELVRQHVEAGDWVFALARSPESAGELASLAAGSGGRLTVHTMDVSRDDSVRAGAASTGSDGIDLIYNVAGTLGNPSAQLEDLDWKDFDDTIEVMLKGPMRVVLAFLPRMSAGGKIMNFSSQLAASTWPYGGFYPYGAAKAGMNRMMRSVAMDLKERGIIVGLIHPGYVQTDMGGPGADISPAESAASIKALAEGWTLEQSGEFYKWNGEPHAW
ncbi:SDR family oxidoreductase [Sphingobium subterraneum]|uniref:NAD(P)-dependent dehydrogenase (Short-subunit alcohol dehydrogenase family) n=1 Tax=Sphingobium subterraneum TaxID=627688 RepID=A0A841IYH8_9SPHN|nr:SDR family oxidoreductase [Sphingobium subterraneum]MBB6124009.1 NAD(P)-dependent dehydrogenase (short-subunit alcohol dehydrogenase family) [Sphingobium subterraneum]